MVLKNYRDVKSNIKCVQHQATCGQLNPMHWSRKSANFLGCPGGNGRREVKSICCKVISKSLQQKYTKVLCLNNFTDI